MQYCKEVLARRAIASAIDGLISELNSLPEKLDGLGDLAEGLEKIRTGGVPIGPSRGYWELIADSRR